MILRRWQTQEFFGDDPRKDAKRRFWTRKAARKDWKSTERGTLAFLVQRDRERRAGFWTLDEFTETQRWAATLRTELTDRRTGEVVAVWRITDRD